MKTTGHFNTSVILSRAKDLSRILRLCLRRTGFEIASTILALIRSKLITGASALFFFCQTAIADHLDLASRGKPLQLKVLIENALKNNHKLQAIRQEALEADARINQAGAWEDPELGFEAMNYSRNFQSTLMSERRVTLSQKIPFPGKLTRKANGARYGARALDEDRRQLELEIVKTIRMAFFNLAVAFEQHDVLIKQRKLFEQLIVLARNNYALGRSQQAEVLNMQVEVASIIGKILTAKREIGDAIGEINHLLGNTDHHHFLIGRPELPAKTAINLSVHTEDVLLSLARTRNHRIAAKNLERGAAEERLALAKMNVLPDFGFTLGYTLRDANQSADMRDSVSAMVSVNLPLWAAVKQGEEKREAAAEKAKAEALIEEEHAELAHAIHLIHGELRELSEKLDLYQTGILPLARQAVTTGRASYLAGKLDYSTLIGSVNRRFQLELEYREAFARYETKVGELEALIGGKLPP